MELQPDLAEAHSNLGIVLTDIGELDEAESAFQRALELRPDYAAAHSRLLFGMQYRPGMTPAELAQAHKEYDQRHAAKFRAAWHPYNNSFDPERRLKIGFISDGLGLHPIGYFLVGLLENVDKNQFEIVCYSDRMRKDAMTARIQASVVWHDVFQVSNEQLAARIRQDRIDILFDLDAHAGRERLLVFARKPAPLQVTWAGYVGTTGLAAMDYLLADRWHVPEGTGIPLQREDSADAGWICLFSAAELCARCFTAACGEKWLCDIRQLQPAYEDQPERNFVVGQCIEASHRLAIASQVPRF